MTAAEFVKAYYPEAYKSYQDSGIHPLAVLAQAALESGWGSAAPNFAFFGIKAKPDGNHENDQLEVTTEYLRVSNAVFPKVMSVVPVVINGQKYFKYTVQDWFRAYKSAKDSFDDHIQFFLDNANYKEALEVKGDCNLFLKAIAKAGYATAPNYAETLISIAKSINTIAIGSGINPIVPYNPNS